MQNVSASLVRADDPSRTQLGFNGALMADAHPPIKQVWVFLGFNDAETDERIHAEMYLTLAQVDELIDELHRERKKLVAALLAKQAATAEAELVLI